MTAPTRLDTGYRYPILEQDAVTPQVLVVDSTLVYIYRDSDGRIVGCRRTLSGREMEPGLRTLVSGYVGPCAVSGPDSSGWKLVYKDRDELESGVWLCSFNARSLDAASESRQVAGNDRCVAPQIAMGAGFHTIAWIGLDAMSLCMRRVDAEMNFLDAEPIPICPARGNAIALAMDPVGGIVVYQNSLNRPAFRLLGTDGLPYGDQTVLDSQQTWERSMAVSRYGSGWLAAWRSDDEIRFTFIDSTGVLDSPIYRHAARGETMALSVCAHDSLGLVLWRDGVTNSMFASLVRRGEGFVGDPILLDDRTTCMDAWMWERDPRTVACAWTGDSFAAMWLGYVPPVVAKRAPTSFWDPFPVLGQWISPDGSLRSAEPVYIAENREPYLTTPIHTNAGYLAFIDDYANYWTGENQYRAVPLDSLGVPSGASIAYSLPSVEDDCAWECTFSSTSGVITHPWAGGAAVAHMENYSYSSEIGTCIDDTDLFVDRIDADRVRAFRHGIHVASGCMPKDELKSYNAAARGDSLLIAWSIGGEVIPFGSLRILDSSGSVLRNWSIRSDSTVTSIVVAPAHKGWVSVWSQGAARGTMRLRKATVDPAVAGSTVTGDWLLPRSFGVPGTPCLVPGPRRIFCFFPAKLGDNYDIYFVRLDSTGASLSSEPICLSGFLGDEGSLNGVWDGNHYFVTYVSRHGSDRATYGNRIGANGRRIDGDGFLIASGSREAPRAASDGRGHVMLGWADRVVRIDDLVQIEGDDDATAPGDSTIGGDEDSEPQDSTDVDVDPPVVRIAGLLNNPSNGEIRLAGPLPGGGVGIARVMDVRGRVIALEPIRSGTDEHPLVWTTQMSDGRRAPTGLYLIRIEAGGMHAIRRVLLVR
jgi:hypothetical protein